MLSSEGQLLCRIDLKKAKWYLSRNLATKVSDDPLVIKLNFEPKGRGAADDPYYLVEKKNICVVCGEVENLTKHHVVPYCFRRFFPDEIKKHTHHDILLLCSKHHTEYEVKANEYKEQLAKEFGISMYNAKKVPPDRERIAVKDAAYALLNYIEHIPLERQRELISIVRNFFHCQIVEREHLLRATEIEINYKKVDASNYGEQIVKSLKDVSPFIVNWRKHFLESMNPQFMPDLWDVNRVDRSDL